MSKSFFQNLLITFFLILVQVLICNHIMLFNIATAFVCIYVIVRLQMDLNTNWLLTWGFLTGLLVDIFSDSPGVFSLACTILAMVKRPCLYAYVPKDDRTKNVTPSLSELGFGVYGKYLFSMSFIFSLLIFVIEYLNFADVKDIVLMSLGSAVFTFMILLGVDSLIVTRSEKGL
ncbi:MAG: rod shape-determining protein MreD [Bacteroidales bacterium]|nr:rod shape-determining protein MreD [Bacteroidales bacterium]